MSQPDILDPIEQAEQQARDSARDPLGRFLPGVSPNPKGRPKGSKNDPMLPEIRDACRLIVLDPDYRQALWKRLIAGEAPHIEARIWDHAFGKAPDVVADKGADRSPIQIVFLENLGDPLEREEAPRHLPEPPASAIPEITFNMEEFQEPEN